MSWLERFRPRSQNEGNLLPKVKPSKKRPFIYWLVIKILCLLHGRKVVSTRKCHKCRLDSIHNKREAAGNTGPLPNLLYPAALDTPAGEGNDDDYEEKIRQNFNVNEIEEDRQDVTKCEVCCSAWWNPDGNLQKYSDEDIGVTRWNHLWSLPLSLFLQLVCLTFLSYDGMTYLISYWGDEKQLVRLISYSTYFLSIASVPVICLVANLRNIVPRTRVSSFAWTTALHPRYIVKRLQYLQTSATMKKPFLVACLLWPLLNSIYRACIYFVLVGSNSTHIYITLVTNGITCSIWGCFCYLIIILRHSICTQLNLDLVFLRKHVGNVDICRRRLATSLDEYGSLCNLCAKWILFNISMRSLGISTQITCSYLVFSGKVTRTMIGNYIDIMIWSEEFMFLSLPLIAIGGLDLQYIWEHFRTRICEARCEKYYKFWENIFNFITEEMNPVTNVVNLTLLFTVISLYMALKLDDQHADYWSKHNVTSADVHPNG